MEATFRKHIEGFLVGFAVILIAAMIGYFMWGMVYISQNLDSVFESKTAGPRRSTSMCRERRI